MLRKLTLGLLIGGILTLSVAAGASAAANPNGTGQPSQSCGSLTASPNGFNTAGFTKAALVYAGSKGTASATNANSSAAVSQYDVACYQVTTNH